MDSPTNEYSLELTASTGATMKANHLVQGDFVHQITEDLIIPHKNLTLLTMIGEGENNIVHCTMYTIFASVYRRVWHGL